MDHGVKIQNMASVSAKILEAISNLKKAVSIALENQLIDKVDGLEDTIVNCIL